MPVGQPEFATNPEPRQPCLLLLDVSGSMAGEPINALNEGLAVYKNELAADTLARLRVETGIISFGGSVRPVHDLKTVEEFHPPRLDADGNTPMGEAIDKALDVLEGRKATYQENGIRYFRPWVFLITDGAPTDQVEAAVARLQEYEDEKKVAFFAVGVEGADMTRLAEIAPVQRKPLKLKGLKFSELFLWLSGSLTMTSGAKANSQVALLPYDGWGEVTN